MDASYIYDIFATTEKNGDSDLIIGMAKLQAERPLPYGTNERELIHFIGRHYKALVAAYKAHDRGAFEEAVLACETADAEAAREEE